MSLGSIGRASIWALVVVALGLPAASAPAAPPAAVQLPPVRLTLPEPSGPPSAVHARLVLPPTIGTSVEVSGGPKGEPAWVDAAKWLRSGMEQSLARLASIEPAARSDLDLEVLQLGMTCFSDATAARCLTVLRGRLYVPSLKLTLLEGSWTGNSGDQSSADGLSPKASSDPQREAHRRRINGVRNAMNRALERSIGQMDSALQSRLAALTIDPVELKTRSLQTLQEHWEHEVTGLLRGNLAQAPAQGGLATDALVLDEACPPESGLAACVPALLAAQVLAAPDLRQARLQGISKAVRAVAPDAGAEQPAKWLVFQRRRILRVSLPEGAAESLVQTQQDINKAAWDAASQSLCVLADNREAADSAASLHCVNLALKDSVEVVPMPAPIRAQSVAGLRLERGSVSLRLHDNSEIQIAVPLAAGSGTPDDTTQIAPQWHVEAKGTVWALKTQRCGKDVEVVVSALAQPSPIAIQVSAPRQVVSDQALAEMFEYLFDAGPLCGLPLERIDRLSKLVLADAATIKAQAERRLSERRSLSAAALADRDAAQAAEKRAEQRRQEELAAARQADIRAEAQRILAMAQASIRKGKSDLAIEQARAACTQDPTFESACALAESLEQAAQEKREREEQARQEKYQRQQRAAQEREERRAMAQAPAAVKSCLAAFQQYLTAKQLSARAAATGNIRAAQAAERTMHAAATRVRSAQQLLRNAIAVYQNRGMYDAARGVERGGARCLGIR